MDRVKAPLHVGAGTATQEGAAPAGETAGASAYPAEGEPIGLMPYTVLFPGPDGPRPVDLEHGAPLPRVGDVVEYIDEQGARRRYRVREVIHTLQAAAAMRPTVAERGSPAAFARGDREAAEVPGDGGTLRAGLPQVVVEEEPL
jgi:hypothetical protein